VKGAYLYKDAAGDKRVGPGSFLRVPGGWKHWSGGDPKDGALFYEESSGKFDTIPAKQDTIPPPLVEVVEGGAFRHWLQLSQSQPESTSLPECKPLMIVQDCTVSCPVAMHDDC
jgi:hypothetical protein